MDLYTAISVINYKTANGSIIVPQGEFFDASGNLLSVSDSSSSTLTFDGKIKGIGNYAFHNCDKLTFISLPNSITHIGYFAFSNCKSLTSPIYNSSIFARLPIDYNSSYSIPDGITRVASAAFRNCTELKEIIIPNSVTSIEESAFAYCKNLSSIYVGPLPANITESTFYYVDKSSCTLYVVPGSKSAYQNAAYWNEFKNIKEYEINKNNEDELIINLNNTETSVGSFKGTTWWIGNGNSGYSKIIPVDGYTKLTIVTSPEHESYVTFTNQVMPTSKNIESADSYLAKDYKSGRIIIEAATRIVFDVPFDAKYIYLTWRTSSGTDRLPIYVKLHKGH